MTIVTRFRILCEGWKDEGDSMSRDINLDKQNRRELSYTFSQKAVGDSEEYRFFHGLAGDITVTSLRTGLRDYDYQVTVYIGIGDSDGYTTVYPLDIKVRSPTGLFLQT